MAKLRPKIVKLAKIIGGPSGLLVKIDENAPEYYCMARMVSDDEADIAIAAGLRKERTAGYLAKKVGKTVEEIQGSLDNLVYYGIFRRTFNKEVGEDVYYMQIFAPGILEMMVNKKDLMEKYPEVGRAFEEYTRLRMQMLGPVLPDGYGLMRVIPVEDAIKDIPGVTEDELLSSYLNKYDRFSVANCSCRASRTSIGDGCGHLDEDMCVNMGKGAEHYIRSGRAREITREEAWQIIKRAEENGLMHNAVNIEEVGESAAICNCCSCACFGLRAGLMFGARDAIRSNYVAEVDEAKCVACAQCVEVCPGNALRLGQKLCSKDDLTPPGYAKLTNTVFVKKTFNPDYRENFKDTVDTGTAPCKTACPAHVPVQGYLKLAAQGRYTEALELIKKENPFPAVCGRICNKRCEAECTRATVDEAVAIDEVKRFIADHDMHEDTRFVPKMVNQIGRPYTEKIAIIGAGPAGMSCAYFLSEMGYANITVFDRNPVPGGMLTLGIPSFRLEKDVLNAEIDILKEMGVEFKCGVEVGKDVTIQQLRDEGYKGFYLAIGAQKSQKLGIAGEELDGVWGGIDLLREVNLGNRPSVGKSCAVIGGGNVAMDVCRTAVRLGAENTYIIYRRSEAELPADPEEVKEAIEEGVKFRYLNAPVEVIGSDGKVSALKLEIMELGEADEKGRRKPVGTGKFETIEVDSVVAAVGQTVDWGSIDIGKLETTKKGTAVADALTYQTAEPDIFVGGDVYTGPKFAIDAIAAGKEAAISLHRYVHPGQTLTMGRDRRVYSSLNKENALIGTDFDHGKRQMPGYNETKAKTFSDARVTFTEEQVRKEAARCLGCGATKVDEYMCVGCGLCTTKCKFDAIHLKKVRDWHAGNFESLPIKLAEGLVKRGVKIVKSAVEK